ncbi:hypothetical protein OG21DRAFT_1482208 [Imleria badia]|nr:hypothetical protein OG21DRAFT_1482208 [Imleria badia]
MSSGPVLNNLSHLAPHSRCKHHRSPLLPGIYETQETGTSIEYSNVSSIAHFPNFQFSLHKITPLSSLYIAAKSDRRSRKVNILLAAFEVHGPDTILVKKGSVCKLTAW